MPAWPSDAGHLNQPTGQGAGEAGPFCSWERQSAPFTAVTSGQPVLILCALLRPTFAQILEELRVLQEEVGPTKHPLEIKPPAPVSAGGAPVSAGGAQVSVGGTPVSVGGTRGDSTAAWTNCAGTLC